MVEWDWAWSDMVNWVGVRASVCVLRLSSAHSVMFACMSVHPCFKGMHLELSCAALCFIWSPAVGTWTPTVPWCWLSLLLLLCGLPVRCLPCQRCMGCLFQLLLIYTRHSREGVCLSSYRQKRFHRTLLLAITPCKHTHSMANSWNSAFIKSLLKLVNYF